MEKRSIYEFIRENLNYNGKLSNDCYFRSYLNDVYGHGYTLDEVYDEYTTLDEFIDELADTQKIDFELLAIIDRALTSLDNSELEKHFESNNLIIKRDKEKIIDVIKKSIKEKDVKKLQDFCEKSIKSTQNMFCMYIYLLITSCISLKKNESLQNTILVISCLPEFFSIIDDYVLDNFDYPDYSRFFLAKRTTNSSFKFKLLSEIPLDNDEIKRWTIKQCNDGYGNSDYIVNIIEKLNIPYIFKKWNIDNELFKSINNIVYILSAYMYKVIDIKLCKETLTLFLDKLCDVYKDKDISQNFESFNRLVLMYSYLSDTNKLDDEFKEEFLGKFRNILVTDNSINTIKERLDEPNITNSEQHKIFSIISNLNITSLYLKIYNTYKKDPIRKVLLIDLFDKNKELHEEALKILYNAINWDEITGKYTNVESNTEYIDSVAFLLDSSHKYTDLALKAITKILLSKYVDHRDKALHLLKDIMEKENLEFEKLSEELKNNITYLYKNELNTSNKDIAKEILGIVDEDEKDEDLYKEFQKSVLKSKFNLVGENDDEVLESYMKENKEKKRVLNLNSRLFDVLNFSEMGIGVDYLVSGKILYIESLKDEIFAFCQGDVFGKEYTLKLIHDKDYNLTDCSCTCGKCKMDDFCKHALGVFIYLSKLYDNKHNIK